MNKKEAFEAYLDKLYPKYYTRGFVDIEDLNKIISNLSIQFTALGNNLDINITENTILKRVFEEIFSKEDENWINAFDKFSTKTLEKFAKLVLEQKESNKLLMLITYFGVWLKGSLSVQGLNISGEFPVIFFSKNTSHNFITIKPNDLMVLNRDDFINFLITREEPLDINTNNLEIIKNEFIKELEFKNKDNLLNIIKNNDDISGFHNFSESNFNICAEYISTKVADLNKKEFKKLLNKGVIDPQTNSEIPFANKYPNTVLKHCLASDQNFIKYMFKFITENKINRTEQTNSIMLREILKDIKKGNKINILIISMFDDETNILKEEWQKQFGYQREMSYKGENIVKNTPASEILNGNVQQLDNYILTIENYIELVKSNSDLFALNVNSNLNMIKSLFIHIWSKTKQDINFFMLEEDDTIEQIKSFEKYLKDTMNINELKKMNIENKNRKQVSLEIINEISLLEKEFKKIDVFMEPSPFNLMQKKLNKKTEELKVNSNFIKKWLDPNLQEITFTESKLLYKRAEKKKDSLEIKLQNKKNYEHTLIQEFNTLIVDLGKESIKISPNNEKVQDVNYSFKNIDESIENLKVKINELREEKEYLKVKINEKNYYLNEKIKTWKLNEFYKANNFEYSQKKLNVLIETEKKVHQHINKLWKNKGYSEDDLIKIDESDSRYSFKQFNKSKSINQNNKNIANGVKK